MPRWSLLVVSLVVGLAVAGCGQERGVEPSPDLSQEPGQERGQEGDQEPVGAVPPLHPSVDDYPQTTLELHTVDGERHRVAVLVADTPQRRQHGLMEVEHLPDGTGMWFVYDEDTDGAFWMKDTLVPLSIAFADADGTILAILDMEPCEADPCPVYDPGVRYRSALEVPAGWFDRVGVTAGARLLAVVGAHRGVGA